VAEPEVDAAMRLGPYLAMAALLLLVGGVALGVPGTASASTHPTPAATGLTGNITGPTVLGFSTDKYYTINGTGGPAYAANGTLIGNVTFYASVTGENTTGVSVTPSESAITNVSGHPTLLTVGNIPEVLTIVVEVSSTYHSENQSINLTYVVTVVQPYTLTVDLISDSSSTIIGFPLTVWLDGSPVGTIHIPSLTAGSTYQATFNYPTLGLSAGTHTFTVSLVNEHGLVTFAGGATTFSTTFYIPGPPPNYTLWYVAGAVAFFGAIFIFVTRVAARRRNPARK
jgi:hypothetical protein